MSRIGWSVSEQTEPRLAFYQSYSVMLFLGFHPAKPPCGGAPSKRVNVRRVIWVCALRMPGHAGAPASIACDATWADLMTTVLKFPHISVVTTPTRLLMEHA